MEKREQTIREVVGENVRRIREEAGARQDDVAAAARAVGLTWTRSKIAALERGEKALDLAEAVLLAEAMSMIADRPVGVGTDLLAGDGAVRLSSERVFFRHTLRRFFGDEPIELQASDVPGGVELVARVPELLKEMAARIGPADSEKYWQIVRRAGETEERAGRTLGLDKHTVTEMAAGLWGRTLAEERDARVGDVPLASRAAKRGRVTRQLLDELRTQRYGGFGHGER
jgi:transcriptional regulator with XRE-family HTH domain